MELLNWEYLGSCAGAAFASAILTQLTKGLPCIRRLPTQLWSYLLALTVLLLAALFGGNAELSQLALTPFNAAVVSLAANGGYEAVERLKIGKAQE